MGFISTPQVFPLRPAVMHKHDVERQLSLNLTDRKGWKG